MKFYKIIVILVVLFEKGAWIFLKKERKKKITIQLSEMKFLKAVKTAH